MSYNNKFQHTHIIYQPGGEYLEIKFNDYGMEYKRFTEDDEFIKSYGYVNYENLLHKDLDHSLIFVKLCTLKSDNNLIAEFMGWQLQDNPKDRWYGSYREPNGILHKNTNKEPMQFHSSWDWLMPVVAKCRQESNPEDSHWEKIYYSLEDTDIDVTYSSVVKFIKNQKL